MPNTITGLYPDLYAAMDTVSREMVGMIPSVTRFPGADRAAVGQKITSPETGAATAQDATSTMVWTNPTGQTVGAQGLTITKNREVPIPWTGNEQALINSGPGYETVLGLQFENAMRTLVNEVESDLAALYPYASRAYGTPGTTPFATTGDYTDAAEVRRILTDNGAPQSDLRLVINTAAGAKFRGKQSDAAAQGADTLIRQGVLLDMHGFQIRESAKIVSHIKGTGTSYQTNNASGYTLGDTTIALDTGSGTAKAGDVVTFTGDANKYVVGTALAAGSLAINKPGLQAGLADNVAMAIGNSYSANLAFSASAIQLATRLPPMPGEGDAAVDSMILTDPRSGISFEVRLYVGKGMVTYIIALAWGVAAVKPAHIALLLG